METSTIIGRAIAPVIGIVVYIYIFPYFARAKKVYFAARSRSRSNQIFNFLLGWTGFVICCLLTLLGESLWGIFFYLWIFAWIYIITANFFQKNK